MKALPLHPEYGDKLPELVIRETSGDVIAYEFETMKAYDIDVPIGLDRPIKLFNPSKVQYLYEPGRLVREPHETEVPTFGSFSPKEARYKEFVKNSRAKMLFMPLYTLSELLAIGKYIRNISSSYSDLFSEDRIIERYEKYGGIIRHVLPEDEGELKTIETRYEFAMSDISLETVVKLLRSSELLDAGNFICQWTAKQSATGEYDFTSVDRRIASEDILLKLKEKMSSLSMEDMRKRLSDLYRDNKAVPLLPHLLQDYVSLFLTKEGNKSGFKRIERSVVQYGKMEEGTLYYPTVTNFPACDMYYKRDEMLYLVQVTTVVRGKKELSTGAIASFLSEIKFDAKLVDFQNRITWQLYLLPGATVSLKLQSSDYKKA